MGRVRGLPYPPPPGSLKALIDTTYATLNELHRCTDVRALVLQFPAVNVDTVGSGQELTYLGTNTSLKPYHSSNFSAWGFGRFSHTG